MSTYALSAGEPQRQSDIVVIIWVISKSPNLARLIFEFIVTYPRISPNNIHLLKYRQIIFVVESIDKTVIAILLAS